MRTAYVFSRADIEHMLPTDLRWHIGHSLVDVNDLSWLTRSQQCKVWQGRDGNVLIKFDLYLRWAKHCAKGAYRMKTVQSGDKAANAHFGGTCAELVRNLERRLTLAAMVELAELDDSADVLDCYVEATMREPKIKKAEA